MNIRSDEATVNAGLRPGDDQDPGRICANNAFLGTAPEAAIAAAGAATAVLVASNRETNDDDRVFASNDDPTDRSRTASVGPHLLGNPKGDFRSEGADNDRNPAEWIEKPRSTDVLLGRGGSYITFEDGA
jgi:hypothetical protein